MSELNPADTIVGRMDNAFKDKVEELSEGKIKIDLKLGGELGNDEELLQAFLRGTDSLHIIRISVGYLESLGASKSVILTLPYVFSSRHQFWEFTKSPLAQEFLDELYVDGHGIKGLFYGEEGFRNFFSVEPVYTPKDFYSKTVRLPEDPVLKKFAQSMGSTPLQIGFNAVHSSIKSGLIDIADQPTVNYLANSFYIEAPNLTLDEHSLGIAEAIISAKIWDSLTEKQQNILIEAGQFASEFCFRISEEKENHAIAALKTLGVNIIEVSDKTEWKKAAESVNKEYAAKHLDLYNKIQNLPK